MSMIQIRKVPDDLHREFKARAALAGMSLSEYLLMELRHRHRPTMPPTWSWQRHSAHRSSRPMPD